MKKFTRIEPTTTQTYGVRFKRTALVKRFRTDDGIEHEFTTEGAEDSHAGAVIALTPGNQVITAYQFRAGPERWMYDVPGGTFNDGEDAKVAALRELKEETGYEPKRVEFLGTSCRSGYFNITWHYFMATGCTLSASGLDQDEEEQDQGAEVRLISIADLIRYAKEDKMTDPHAVLMAYDKLMQLAGEA